ncbi:MAG: propionyl-CoA synthetase, partial [Planctomycetota bacterium]
VLDEQGNRLPANTQGYIAVELPLPPSCLTAIWGDVDRFRENYLETYPGYFSTGDGGYFDEDGYLFIMGRVDDVINVAGHRLSTGEMEEVVGRHPMVAECAVIGRSDELKGQIPMGFVVLKNSTDIDPEKVVSELVALVRQDIGAVAAFKQAVVVARLPKTRSGKILRKTLRAIVDGEDYVMPSTIEDPAALDEIKALLG